MAFVLQGLAQRTTRPAKRRRRPGTCRKVHLWSPRTIRTGSRCLGLPILLTLPVHIRLPMLLIRRPRVPPRSPDLLLHRRSASHLSHFLPCHPPTLHSDIRLLRRAAPMLLILLLRTLLPHFQSLFLLSVLLVLRWHNALLSIPLSQIPPVWERESPDTHLGRWRKTA